jgi:eukaryotic-like serine/threonine-protein kinase
VSHAAEQQSNNVQLVLVDMQGQKTVLGNLPDSVVAPRVSPDGKQVAFELTDPPASATAALSSTVYVADLDKLDKRRALPQTIIEPRNFSPVWSPDEAWIVFQGSGNGSDDLFQARVIANSTEQPLYIGDGRSPQSIDSNGRVTFLTLKGDKDYGISQLDPGTRKVTRLVDQPGSAQYSSAISPDGRWIAYASDETGRPEVWLEPLPTTGKRLQLTKNGGSHPEWSPDGRKIYFDQGGQMFQMDIATSGEPAGEPAALPIKDFQQRELRRQYDLTPDGKGFVMLFPADAGGK